MASLGAAPRRRGAPGSWSRGQGCCPGRPPPHKDVYRFRAGAQLDSLSSMRMFGSGWDCPQRRLFPWEFTTPPLLLHVPQTQRNMPFEPPKPCPNTQSHLPDSAQVASGTRCGKKNRPRVGRRGFPLTNCPPGLTPTGGRACWLHRKATQSRILRSRRCQLHTEPGPLGKQAGSAFHALISLIWFSALSTLSTSLGTSLKALVTQPSG